MVTELSEKLTTLGYSILYPYSGMDVKFQALPKRKEFHGISRMFEFSRAFNAFE